LPAVSFSRKLGVPKPLILRWNGSGWKQAPSPSLAGGLSSVAATSSSSAWAVGTDGNPLIEHWNGTKWAKVAAPSGDALAGLNGVTATSPTNAWAVGTPDGGPGHTTGIAHWNGHTWR
jgi:photosystem II stability/assembly factor-like uncharacterized protein